MNVTYFHHVPGKWSGNIQWTEKHPMRAGRFPRTHPCASNPEPMVYTEAQPDSADPLGRFRARGYWASCFPEGDGITFEDSKLRAAAEVVRDVEECFGWTVTIRRGDQE